MPWYEYSFLPGSTRPLPLIEVDLWNGATRVRFAALVDSGADLSVLDVSYADALGLDRTTAVRDQMTVAGGGQVDCLTWPGAPLEFEFAREKFPFEGAFVDVPPGSQALNLLGRKDFFSRYIVQFWDANEMLNIDLSPDYPRPLP